MLRRGGAQILEDNTLRSEEHLQKNTETPEKPVDLKQIETGEEPASEVKQTRQLNGQVGETASISSHNQLKFREFFVPRHTEQLQINPIMNIALSNDEFRETYGILDLAWEENEKNDPDYKLTKEDYEKLIEKSNNHPKFRKDKIPSILEAWESFFKIPKGRYFYLGDPGGWNNSPIHDPDMKFVIVEFDKELNFLDKLTMKQGGDWIELTKFFDGDLEELNADITKNKYEPLKTAVEKLLITLNSSFIKMNKIKQSFGKEVHFRTIEKALITYPGANENARTFAVPNPRWLLRKWLRNWETWKDHNHNIDVDNDEFFPFITHIKEPTVDNKSVTNLFIRSHKNKIFKMWIYFNTPFVDDQRLYDYTGPKSYNEYVKVTPNLWGKNFLKNIMSWYWYMYKPGYALESIPYEKKNNWGREKMKNWLPELQRNPRLGMWNLLDIYRNYNLYQWNHQMFADDWYVDMLPFIHCWMSACGRFNYSYWFVFSNYFMGNKRYSAPFKDRWKYINKFAELVNNKDKTWKKQKKYSLYIS